MRFRETRERNHLGKFGTFLLLQEGVASNDGIPGFPDWETVRKDEVVRCMMVYGKGGLETLHLWRRP